MGDMLTGKVAVVTGAGGGIGSAEAIIRDYDKCLGEGIV